MNPEYWRTLCWVLVWQHLVFITHGAQRGLLCHLLMHSIHRFVLLRVLLEAFQLRHQQLLLPKEPTRIHLFQKPWGQCTSCLRRSKTRALSAAEIGNIQIDHIGTIVEGLYRGNVGNEGIYYVWIIFPSLFPRGRKVQEISAGHARVS